MFLRGGDAALHRLLQLFVRRGDVLSGGRFLGVEFAAKLFIASLRRLGRRLGRLLRLLDGGGEFLSRRLAAASSFSERASSARSASALAAASALNFACAASRSDASASELSRPAFPFGVQSLPRLRLRRGYRGVAFLLGGGERLARLLLGGEEFLLRLLLRGDDFRLRDAFRLERRVARLRELLRGCFFRRVQLAAADSFARVISSDASSFVFFAAASRSEYRRSSSSSLEEESLRIVSAFALASASAATSSSTVASRRATSRSSFAETRAASSFSAVVAA